MCSVLSGVIFCLGIFGYSESIENVAQRRYVAEWGGLSSDPQNFDILLGVEDCKLLGRTGWVITGNGFYSALIVDCNQPAHTWPKNYLADVNRRGCQEGYLIIKPKGGER